MFPVYAGVILPTSIKSHNEKRVPRVCGGDPGFFSTYVLPFSCSPCIRGCYEVIIDKYMKKLMRHTV